MNPFMNHCTVLHNKYAPNKLTQTVKLSGSNASKSVISYTLVVFDAEYQDIMVFSTTITVCTQIAPQYQVFKNREKKKQGAGII